MALHGDIQVNYHQIGSWTAVNIGTDEHGLTTYAVKVAYTNMAGYHTEAKFEVTHNRYAGALALAAKVLAAAPEHLTTIPLDEDGYAVHTMAERLSR